MEFEIPIPGKNETRGQFLNQWHEFIKRFNCRQDPSGHFDTSLLLHFGADTIKDIQLCNKICHEEFDRFKACIETLESQCLFQTVLCFLRHLFFTHCRPEGNSMGEFYKELRLLSDLCSFDEKIHEDLIKKQLISNIHEKSTRDVISSMENLTAINILDICSIAEKQGAVVTPDLIDIYLREQQHQNSFISTPGMSGKKHFGWSTVSFVEGHETNMDEGLNFNSSSYFGSKSNAQRASANHLEQAIRLLDYGSLCAISSDSSSSSDSGSSIDGLNDFISFNNSTAHIAESHSPVLVSDKVPSSSSIPTGLQTNEYDSATQFTFPPAFESATTSHSTLFQGSSNRKEPLVAFDDNDISQSEGLIQPIAGQSAIDVIDTSASSYSTSRGHSSNDNSKTCYDESNDITVENKTGDLVIMPVHILDASNDDNESNDEIDDKSHNTCDNPNDTQDTEKQNPLWNVGNCIDLEGNDCNEILSIFVSQQSAILRSSQIDGATGEESDLYYCNFCAFTCAGRSSGEEHALQTHASLKCYVCSACDFKFPSKDQIDSHVRLMHLNVEEHKCQICDMVFDSQRKLHQHHHEHADPIIFLCSGCSATFSSEKQLSDHMLEVHPNKNRWICRVCNALFPARSSLSDHISKVHNYFDSDILLKRGGKEEATLRACRLCELTFSDLKSLRAHYKKCHEKKKHKIYSCDQCDHISNTSGNLASHKKIHTGEKPFMCKICGKAFAQSSSLDKHARTHTGEKPYKCQYCELSFSVSSNRLVHERRHRKERPYICEQCGKTYPVMCQLKAHLETHDLFRTKKFVCHCGSAFDARRKLVRHQQCHKDRKKHACETCGAEFTRLENLRGHQRSQACLKRGFRAQPM